MISVGRSIIAVQLTYYLLSICGILLLLPFALGCLCLSLCCSWLNLCLGSFVPFNAFQGGCGAGFMPIYWTSRAVIHVLVLMVETTAFTTRKAVYYTVGTRVSCSAGISTVHAKRTISTAIFVNVANRVCPMMLLLPL